MKVVDIMRRDYASCSVDDRLNVAAQMMWDRNVASVVVLSGSDLAGILTDRDIAMSALTQGRLLSDIPVKTAMASEIVSAGRDDRLDDVLERMRTRTVRHCPIVDVEGRVLGVVSLDDLAKGNSGRQLGRVRLGQVGVRAQRAWAQVRRTLRMIRRPGPDKPAVESPPSPQG
jgi:CBS domain-containing protein